ncbi:MAG: Transcriptional regulator, LysR family [uncultured Ramlibacter sp.]|uniref:Transcriptional regulator, LysR family n=1 Tax=uncultured Ramlibacter sp. TaxID=260755 RepID=A0A6J4P929_9BURK|nr:MAG: Transcriptional regulator, LysR family [uncultured Ramlibacter sp.]
MGDGIVPARFVRINRLNRNRLFRDTERMNLMRLEVFVTVCLTGSFTRAAERLAITKSAASQHVAALERELGSQLLHRSTRSLTLTESGTQLLEDARRLLDQAQQLAERARQPAAQLTGVLRLTSSEDTAAWVAPVIAQYVRLHPGMQVEYRPSDRLLDLVAEGMDISLRATGRRDSNLHAVNLAVFDVWCVASAQYLDERGTPRRLADLASHAWIAFTQIPHPWTLHTRDGKDSVRLPRAISTSSTAGGRALALAGAGIFAAPRFVLAAEVAATRLVRVLPNIKLPQVTLYAAWPGHREPAAKTRAFIELAKARREQG